MLERIDADDAPGRTDDAGGEFGQSAGARADVEHVIARFQCKRADQEFAVMKLQNAGLIVGLRQRGRVLCETDDAAELRHSVFLDDCCCQPARRGKPRGLCERARSLCPGQRQCR